MKFLKNHESFIKWNKKSEFISGDILKDIKDIFLEFDDIDYQYKSTKIEYKIIDNVISIYDHKHSPFLISDISDVIGRLIDFLRQSNLFYKKELLGRSSHYFNGKWNTTAEKVEIIINKPQIKESVLLSLQDNVDYELVSIIENNFKKGSSILEISCGNAADSLYLKDLGYDVTCTEYDDNYVDNAIDLGLNCIKHDSRDKFPFNNDEFDLVYSRLGLHYFTEVELESIFKELSRIGNSILITVKVEEDDFKTGKVIISPEKWKNITNKYFNIVHFDINQGKLYGKDSKWLKIFAK